MDLKEKALDGISKVKTYWKIPMPGRYMTFREIVAYAGGGIGAYFIITMGNALLLNANNMIIADGMGIDFTHVYIFYVIATLANIPLTAIRANMIDNTRNKAGKYRPYLISMGIPTVIVVLSYVYFPYETVRNLPLGKIFGYDGGYILNCIAVLIFNFLLQFFFKFFYDAYTNLIHVLSPNTQERTDVLSIKSVVYSLAPSIVQIVIPLVAQFAANDDPYDMKVYRIAYPVFAILGMSLTVVVFGYTKEKIVQPKSRVIQVKFVDAFKAVAKNKYFWIIALAGWLGFLEGSYSNIMNWTYTYGHACEGSTMSLINTIVGNASMWGMIVAPLCIRKFGKKKVLLGINFMNIVCILAMGLNKTSIIWLAVCVYFNWFFGAFEQITTPAIQADIRDYHQYKTGERVDGMFSTVQTIGDIVTLATSAVLPFVYKSYGIYEGNGYATQTDILDVNTGKPGLLEDIIGVLIIMAAVGALMNMIPYIFYNLKEKDHKGIVRVLKIRAMFEDYGNGVKNDANLVEAIDIIENAKVMHCATPKELDKKSYKSVSDKQERKAAKKAYIDARNYNEDIEISKIVWEELNKFESEEYQYKVEAYTKIYNDGLMGLYNTTKNDILNELVEVRKLPSETETQKKTKKVAIEIAKSKLSARKAIDKYYKSADEFVKPDYRLLDSLFDAEDMCNAKLKELYEKQDVAKKRNDWTKVSKLTKAIEKAKARKKETQKRIKEETDKHIYFNRAAKPYFEADKLLKQKESYSHLEDISSTYEAAKYRYEKDLEHKLAEEERKSKEEKANREKIKAKKEAAKKAKANKK